MRSGTLSTLLSPTSCTPNGLSPLPASRCSKRRPRTSVFTPKPKSTPTILTGDRCSSSWADKTTPSPKPSPSPPSGNTGTPVRSPMCSSSPTAGTPLSSTEAGPRSRRLAWSGCRRKDCDGMEIGVAGKHAIVTGASKGIGLAITQALVREGAYVTAGARESGPELDQMSDAKEVQSITVDLSSPTGPDELVAAA